MANWGLPTINDLYTNIINYFSAKLNDLALMLDSVTTSPTNLPTGAKRWNSTSRKWEQWNGSTWSDMAASYAISITGNAATATSATTASVCSGNSATATNANYATSAGSCTGNSVTATTATNSSQLGGYLPSTTAAANRVPVSDANGFLNVTGVNANALKFPASAVLNSDPNTLDDYEEGTFTPTILINSWGHTPTTVRGEYTKIGRMVTLCINFVLGTVSSPSGTLNITNIPFVMPTGTRAIGAGSVFVDGFSAGYGYMIQHTDTDTLVINRCHEGDAIDAGLYVRTGSVIKVTYIFFQ